MERKLLRARKAKDILKSYWFIISMLIGIVGGCIVGAVWPGATSLEPLGTVFINLMFCVVVPMVFCSIASAIANMKKPERAGKVLGVTVLTFLVTAAIAAIIMYIIARLVPLATTQYQAVEGEVDEGLGVADMIVNFFTKPDFTELFSRRAILPLIVAAILFGFLLGDITSELFIPLLNSVGASAYNMPPFKVVWEAADYLKIYAGVAVMMIIDLVILSTFVSKIKMNQALNLGED